MSGGDALARYIAQQRWSGARGERLGDVRVESAVPVSNADASCVVVRATVGGEPVRFQLWTAADARGDAEPADALSDERVRLAIARFIADGERADGDGAALVGEPELDARAALAGLSTSKVGSAEQSNTSIIYDDRVILKLFRRLARGTQPDVEVTRFLSRRGFAHTPPLLGTLSIADADGATVAGMAQRFVAGARDAWAHAVGLARAAAHDANDEDRAQEAHRLGTVTRALHDALASDDQDPDFAPQAATAATAAGWADAAARQAEQGIALLRERVESGALDALPERARAEAESVVAAGADAAAAAVRDAAASAGDDVGAATRHHGDYHLGQVLRAPDGALFVIDFEGEPARPLAERRARHCPLRDVAGMLRSFAYAAATAALERPDDDAVAARAALWERAARDAFVGGYFGAGPAAYLPRARASADALLTVFELEKAFYELQYELRNRPSWVPIPLAGIARLAAHHLSTDRMR